MNVLITPKKLSGTVAAVPSKSELHRYLILAYLAGRDPYSCLPGGPVSDDVLATAEGLAKLRAKNAPVTIDCRGSAASLRFLLPVASAALPYVTFTGSARLAARPVKPLLAALETQGFRFSSRTLPFTVTRDAVPQSPVYTLPGGVSSQFVSGLLLASPLTGGVTVRLSSPLASGSYADMTLSYLRAFGARAERSAKEAEPTASPDQTPDETGPTASAEYPVFTVHPPVDLTFPENLRVGGDWSNAAFFLAAGVSVTGLDKASIQGDKKILPLLAEIRGKDNAFLAPFAIDCSDIPDLVPPLAVTAAAYRKDLTLTHVRRLRGKESDRIASICDMLTALGVKASAGDDSLTIAGSAAPISGGTVDGWGDHRIVMAAALAASFASAPVTILGAEAVDKSYPSFWEDYRKAGGEFRVLS